MAVVQCLGLLLCLLDQPGRQGNRVERPEVGEGERTETWEVSGDGYSEKIAMEIAEREPSGEEANALFSEAIEEIDRSFPGENESLDCVTEKVNVRNTYADGLVEASWSFDPSGLVASDGTLQWEEIGENTLVQAEALLTLGSLGSLIYAEGTFHKIPAYPPHEVVDATGCGDTYVLGYLYMRNKGASYEEAGCFAAAMSTIKLEKSGPFSGTEEEVWHILKNNKQKPEVLVAQ